jgi:hypothetical protein
VVLTDARPRPVAEATSLAVIALPFASASALSTELLVPPAEPRLRDADAPRVREAEALVARGRGVVAALRVRARELDGELDLVERVAGA